METEQTDDYYTFCGLGVHYQRMTEFGVQVGLIESTVQTPAKQIGMKDGDIIAAVQTHRGWEAMQGYQDFGRLLSGIEGERIPLRILRGYPSREPDVGSARGRGQTHAQAPEVALESLELIEAVAIRSRIYPGLPASIDPRQVPFQSLEEMLECVPMSRLPNEATDMAMLGELSSVLANQAETGARLASRSVNR